MTGTAVDRSFDGPFKNLLTELAGLIDWLRTEHDKSYVKAGDDKVYAYGGDGYVLVVDESLWSGLIELITPGGGLSIKPGEDSKVSVSSSTTTEAPEIKKLLRDGIDGLKNYYENRYWSTPKTSQ